jgi:hypothetical protein
MTEEIKKAFQLAEKELEETKINKLKEVVKQTLEKIEYLIKEKGRLEEKIKILKMDIDDLKVGRLDKIEERQKTSEVAKETSVIVVKEKQVVGIPCQVHSYVPYWQRIYEIVPAFYYEPTCSYFTGTTGTANLVGNTLTTTCGNTWTSVTLCSTDCQSNVTGTYHLASGTVKYL